MKALEMHAELGFPNFPSRVGYRFYGLCKAVQTYCAHPWYIQNLSGWWSLCFNYKYTTHDVRVKAGQQQKWQNVLFFILLCNSFKWP